MKVVSKSKLGIILLILSILIVAGAIVVYFLPKDRVGTGVPRAITHACSDELIGRAGTAIANHDIGDTIALKSEVEKLNGYTDDPNCTYILAINAIFTNDIETAVKSITRLRTLQKIQPGYSSAFKPAPYSLAELDKMVSTQRVNQEREQASRQNHQTPAMPVGVAE